MNIIFNCTLNELSYARKCIFFFFFLKEQKRKVDFFNIHNYGIVMFADSDCCLLYINDFLRVNEISAKKKRRKSKNTAACGASVSLCGGGEGQAPFICAHCSIWCELAYVYCIQNVSEMRKI